MRSDDIKPRPVGSVPQPGAGHPVRLLCGRCGKSIPNLGRKRMRVLGALVWVGQCCQPKETPCP